MLFPGEKEAVADVIAVAEIYGYGNLIYRLSEAWSEKLQKEWGLPKDTADSCAFHPSARTAQIEKLESKIVGLEKKLKAQRKR